MKHLWNIFGSAFVLFVLLSAWPLSANAETIKSCESIPADYVDWNSSVTLPKFDPDMGTLKKVDLECMIDLSQGIELENKNPSPAKFKVSVLGELNVMLPSSQNVSIKVNHSSHGNVSGYDGAVDYEGPSGVNSSYSIPIDAEFKSISNLKDFLAGSHGENITLPVVTNIRPKLNLPGNARAEVTVKAGAKVCITYTYDVNANEGAVKP
jgi:hypothetical protein